jgi:hypothetical protein
VVGSSTESFDNAIRKAIRKVVEALRNIEWFQTDEIRGQVADGEVSYCRSAENRPSSRRLYWMRSHADRLWSGRMPRILGDVLPSSCRPRVECRDWRPWHVRLRIAERA